MDDVAAHLNPRKRKAVDDDVDQDPLLVQVADSLSGETASASVASWFPTPPAWPTSLAFRPNPQKRARLQKLAHRASPMSRRHSSKRTCVIRSPPPRLGTDLEDIGIVSTTDPGPASGSLLRLRDAVFDKSPVSPPSTFSVPIDPNSTHIPPLQPPINRHTLKELDLDVIIRNPQLRHDLLFDPGLQFRPTSTRRKTERAEKYWVAVTCELESGCTCVSFDVHGKPHPTVCACAHVSTPSSNPIIAFSPTLNVATLRMPSRVRILLEEFLQVILLVIQPMSGCVQAPPSQDRREEHCVQTEYLRSVFDPALIEQELAHGVFDPSSLFRAIGLTLQGHCAPMRDQAVEMMVQLAQSCSPGGNGTKADAVKAVRMCMDILELMKLDIANHQLQTLRPFLLRTSGQFELRSFTQRSSPSSERCCFQKTRRWLTSAHETLMTRSTPIAHPLYPPNYLCYPTLQRNQQVYLAVLKGLTDLAFTPPSPATLTQLPTSHAPIPASKAPAEYPETVYLDTSRILLLSTDAVDLSALYMFLLLHRQLGSRAHPTAEVLRIKQEIRDIGSSRLGYAFYCESPPESEVDTDELLKWKNLKESVVLQIVRRAKNETVDGAVVRLAQDWASHNIRHGSTLGDMLRIRLRDAVFSAVVSLAYPGRDATSGCLSSIDLATFGRTADLTLPSGMEALEEEIGSLAEHIARLALIHVNAYLPLYETEDFLQV
ncbi:unnamed protein product [Mycena citricolor]|uniref:Tcp11-domain-containing protein n=1 Tax=Mycena citricolor TaxID=2018698 RepID=A0AAD2K9I3_9AGAR|nr:unnamed protein product [Mycena citricolor]